MEPSPLLQTVEHETAHSPEWCVLWLHGLGADGHDFAPIVPELVRPGWPAIRFVFPHAPMRAVTINSGMRMRAWYDIRNFSADELGGGDRADSAGVFESIAQVEAVVIGCRRCPRLVAWREEVARTRRAARAAGSAATRAR